jgi:hypothetical protein
MAVSGNVEARRAIEALRAGVPNRQAVQALGGGQRSISERFEALLRGARGVPPRPARGFLIEGEFGVGKSHQVEQLRMQALNRGFAVSRIHISKATPLSDLDLVYREALKELALPDRRGGDLDEVLLRLNPKSTEYRDALAALQAGDSTLDPLFVATFLVQARIAQSDGFVDDIKSFWSGGGIKVSDVRKHLKAVGVSGLAVNTRKASELTNDRFAFGSLLMTAAGYNGWVLLLDEVELIAKFPTLGRAKSYVNLADLLGLGPSHYPHLVTVAASAAELTGEIFIRRRDHEKIPLGLRKSKPLLAEQVASALRYLPPSGGLWERIEPPTEDDFDRVYLLVRDLYRRAFGWETREARRPPDTLMSRTIRAHIREWIARWDLERIDPSYAADIVAEHLAPDLSETDELADEAFEGTAAEDDLLAQ